jgi:hypothetical protein
MYHFLMASDFLGVGGPHEVYLVFRQRILSIRFCHIKSQCSYSTRAVRA